MRLYCDAQASTPLDPRVLDIYVEALKSGWANPSSVHAEGQVARSMLAEARSMCAHLFHVLPKQIVFYSSATEALNSLIYSLFRHSQGAIVTSDVDHPAVIEPCRRLASLGKCVEVAHVGEAGALLLKHVTSLKGPIGGIVTSSVNNETGIVTDVSALASLAKEMSFPLIIDGVAGIGKSDVSLVDGMSAICFASHKMYAPKGVGMAVLSTNCKVESYLLGGGQESGKRAGTENVPAIWAFAHALRFLLEEQEETQTKLQKLRDEFETALVASIPGIEIHGKGRRVASVSNLYIEGVSGEELMMLLDLQGISISVGSACHAGALEPSTVLSNMYSTKHALSSVRISFCKYTCEQDINRLVEAMKQAIYQLRRC